MYVYIMKSSYAKKSKYGKMSIFWNLIFFKFNLLISSDEMNLTFVDCCCYLMTDPVYLFTWYKRSTDVNSLHEIFQRENFEQLSKLAYYICFFFPIHRFRGKNGSSIWANLYIDLTELKIHISLKFI